MLWLIKRKDDMGRDASDTNEASFAEGKVDSKVNPDIITDAALHSD